MCCHGFLHSNHLKCRLQVSLVTRVLDVALLVALARLPASPAGPLHLLVGVHLSRTAAANCSRAIMRSVLVRDAERSASSRLASLGRGERGGRGWAWSSGCRHVLLIRTPISCSLPLYAPNLLPQMDFVAKRYRAQVSALESVRVFSWSGSAALGG